MSSNDLLKGHRERLRLRYLEYLEARNINFPEYEFLELLLTYAIQRKDVKPIAKNLLKNFKNIENIINADIKDLENIPGIGKNTAIYIKALGDLVSKITLSNLKDEKAFNSMTEIHTKNYLVKYLRGKIGHLNQEIFLVLFLNSSNKLIKTEELFYGTIDKSAVYPREIIKKVLQYGATSVIFAHNHPSGNIMPSKQDIKITNFIKEGLSTINVVLLDHIIISKNNYFSFFEEKLL